MRPPNPQAHPAARDGPDRPAAAVPRLAARQLPVPRLAAVRLAARASARRDRASGAGVAPAPVAVAVARLGGRCRAAVASCGPAGAARAVLPARPRRPGGRVTGGWRGAPSSP
ncbi:hypothetical protein FRAHR75_410033 [Frankia sp. Hr75.2]|nr:hypothetical protein FRAHR75_410033 [Frankia sp. Hr75.2]